MLKQELAREKVRWNKGEGQKDEKHLPNGLPLGQVYWNITIVVELPV